MSPDRQSLIEKIEALPAEKVAEVENFVDSIARRGSGLARAASRASEPSFARVWNNPEDDAYDAL
jgi:hypothetical protein